VSDVEPPPGWCYFCNEAIEGDAAEHFRSAHPHPDNVPWQHRINNVIGVLKELHEKPDLDRLDDEVLQELYLVRARLAQMRAMPVKRVKEGPDYARY